MTRGEKVAEALAREAHAAQRDKVGNPYIWHVERVVKRCSSPSERIVAWLHDVVEDTSISLDDLHDVHGFPSDPICDAVQAITHRPGEPREAYYQRVRTNPLALVVKRADLADNTDPRRLLLLDAETMIRLMRKYATALNCLGV